MDFRSECLPQRYGGGGKSEIWEVHILYEIHNDQNLIEHWGVVVGLPIPICYFQK